MTVSDVYDYFWNYMQQLSTAASNENAAKDYLFNATGSQTNVNVSYAQYLNEQKSLYIGKAVYQYEISNPTNYNMYVDIYDIIAKKDYVNTDPKPFWDYNQLYVNVQSAPPVLTGSSAATAANGYPQSNVVEYPDIPYPEACMYYNSHPITIGYNRILYPSQNIQQDVTFSESANAFSTATQTGEYVETSGNQIDNVEKTTSTNTQNTNYATSVSQSKWNSLGMNPTNYRLFNTFWKVKKVTRIMIEPNRTYKHNLIVKLGQIYDRASFFYRFPHIDNKDLLTNVGILGGVTTGCMFRTYGQIAVEASNTTELTQFKAASSNTYGLTTQTEIEIDAPNRQQVDTKGKLDMNNRVFNLPGKLIVKRTKRENIYYGPPTIISYKTISDLNQSVVDKDKVKIMTDKKERVVETTQDMVVEEQS
ncbi:hypothetical protein BCR32DRAFT_250935 [Anaeromyces robustus]|uniref:Uncharacterized protein n=1 Tax=Anaeromyces robustus TaxID=1754192 RepID=A0A1Y1VVL6_9FUNG|nr:hypothetical protein BCR32DRAFT_250935 [Anaeromyces robustus]|eukprot:ORX64804.1 hypothetical protein BCR32DRAFT_250935 [Anaeromyces robustus]